MAARKNQTVAVLEHDEADNRVVLPASTAAALDCPVVVLFELDGREFTVPAKPRAVVSLRYLRAIKQGGQELAAAQLLTDLLGADGFNALCEYEDLTPAQFKAILEAAQRLSIGSMEEAFGGNSNGSKR